MAKLLLPLTCNFSLRSPGSWNIVGKLRRDLFSRCSRFYGTPIRRANLGGTLLNLKRLIQLLVVLLLLLLLFLLLLRGCRKSSAKLAAGVSTASIEAPNALLTAITINNDGTALADNVQVTSVSVSGATLTLPTSLPFSLGSITPGRNTILDANFNDPSVQPNSDYPVTVAGTFHENGHSFNFSLQQTVHTGPASPGSRSSGTGTSTTLHNTGAPFPGPSAPPAQEHEQGHAPPIPTGSFHTLTPSNPSRVEPAPAAPKPPGGGAGSISFPTNNPLGFASSLTAEPSGASDPTGQIIFETANWYASFSIDGGTTFKQISPYTTFPSADGGFCCDQIVTYAPTIDRFIWVLQYNQTQLPTDKANTPTGPNRYRIASASPATLKSSNGTSWDYFDITSPGVIGTANSTWLDYPDASIGDNSFYLSADDVNNNGHVVIRVPLSDIKNNGTINWRFTTPSDSATAYGGHLTQNTGNEIFWAGHNNNSSVRVFNWPESSTSYSWRDVTIGSWPQATASNVMTSTTPDNQDWLLYNSSYPAVGTTPAHGGFPGNAVIGLARSVAQRDSNAGNLLYFAWTGAIGNGFPQVQVQWIAIDRNNNFSLNSQQQVWNPGYAYAYPDFAINSRNELGMSLEWGGGGNYENHVAGFWGDYVVYQTTNSAIGGTRFGDHVTIRNHTADLTKFDAFGYGINKATPPATGGVSDVHYLVFSR
jgi:hypothetical protein